jgi:NADPH:quinone reductase-like Zn-dependent oxidoreductase
MFANTAAWLVQKQARLEVKKAAYTQPSSNEIVVRNHAVAMNPVDWISQGAPGLVCPWMKFPFVLGSDVAGEVVEVGSSVSRFKIGDRLIGHAVGVDKKRNRVSEGAFQQYTILLDHMASPIPDSLSYEHASVLPLGISTAACGLFQKDHLALEYPSENAKPTGETLLVWGGSTSVGSNAIQLAVAAGYQVITTASPANFGYVQGLGASYAFNYNSPTIVNELVEAFRGRTIAGAIAIGATSASACLDVVHRSEGKKFVSMASFPLDFRKMAKGAAVPMEMFRQSPKLVSFAATLLLKSKFRGIGTKAIYGTTLMDNEVSRILYADFLPKALSDGRYVAAPSPLVVGRGIASIQSALEVQMRGVSATKVVVSL